MLDPYNEHHPETGYAPLPQRCTRVPTTSIIPKPVTHPKADRPAFDSPIWSILSGNSNGDSGSSRCGSSREISVQQTREGMRTMRTLKCDRVARLAMLLAFWLPGGLLHGQRDTGTI